MVPLSILAISAADVVDVWTIGASFLRTRSPTGHDNKMSGVRAVPRALRSASVSKGIS